MGHSLEMKTLLQKHIQLSVEEGKKKKSLFSSSLFGSLRALSLFFHVFRVVRFDVSFSSRRSLAGVVHAEISLARAYNFGSLESSEAPHRAFPRFSLSYAMLFEV